MRGGDWLLVQQGAVTWEEVADAAKEAAMRYEYYMPLDPACPDNPILRLLEDPMSQGAPLDDIIPDLERKHRRKCERCKEFGTEHIEVIDL